jgi:signal transduction histidine kinase
MVTTAPVTTTKKRTFSLARLTGDYAYVMPGFFISLFAFVVLVPLTALAISTLIIWVGVVLLPLTLVIASGFAELSRARLRHWGVSLPPARYAPVTRGLTGFIKRIAEPRRWLDLAFETVVALPLRTFTFVVATTWTAGALGGITHVFWGVFLPQDDLPLPGMILEAITDGAAPDAVSRSYLLDTGFSFVCGVILLLTLPLVMRGLARLDAAATAAALGGLLAPASEVAPASPASPAAIPSPPADTDRTQDGPGRLVSGSGWAWITAIFVAIVSIAVGWPVLSVLYGTPVVAAMCLALAFAAALLVAVRWPRTGVALQTAAAVATAAVTAASPGLSWLPWPWPVMTLILQVILVLIVALRHPWPLAITAWAVPPAGVLLATIAIGITPGARVSLIVSASVTAGLLAIGIAIRQLVSSRGALQEERRASAELSAQRTELQERNRIAQELHDVVAHSMSVISIQATTARYRLPGMDSETEQEFQSIAASSRQALTEMRGLLAVLRSPDREAELAPQPALTDIPALVDATLRSGARISFRSNADAAAASVPAATGLTAYRIVQEALSNAVRHAPGAEIDVAVTLTEDRLEVEVVNGPADGPDGYETAPGAGLGLTGARDRAAALGGAVDAGPHGSGGFRVHAVLPLA